MSPKIIAGAGAAAAAGAAVARWRLRNWGATPTEVAATYPGDELIPTSVATTTYAVTVDAPAAEVWRWLVQMGQDRGGMYSYEALENAFGLDIHNTDEIRREWQTLSIGDQVRVVPRGKLGMPDGYAFRVAVVEPPTALVLRQQPPEHPWNATWAFLVVPVADDCCRLISRSRAASTPGVAGLLARIGGEVMSPVILLMTSKMLRGIKQRAEGDRSVTTRTGTVDLGAELTAAALRHRVRPPSADERDPRS